jgi:hypothetical protein
MEYYAKIFHIEKGFFRLGVTIWKTNPDTKIDKVVASRRFLTYTGAIRWAQRSVAQFALLANETMFIREKDIIRRKWND